MSTSTAYHGVAARGRGRSSRKNSSPNLFGVVAVACVIAGCGWTLYSNVFGASIYPVASGIGVDLTPVKRPVVVAQRDVAPVRSASVLHLATAALPDVTAALPSGPTLSFDDRFASLARQGVEPAKIQPQMQAVAEPQTTPAASPRQQVASIPTPPRRPAEARPPANQGPSLREIAQASKAMAVANATAPKPNIFDKLFGTQKPAVLAYAAPDGGVGSDGRDSIKPGLYDRTTAVYDISAKTVYLPDGTKLEAHSGLGSKIDDPRYVHVKMHGATPPHIYDLKPREALFHGVAALRLNPVGGEEAIHGRTGLLAHTYMLGPNGDSNGCVSFKDYNKFLQAYRNGDVKRLVVVAKID